VERQADRRRWVEQIMGMPCSLLLRGAQIGDVEPAVTAAYDELRRADALFSTYDEASEVSRLRRGELTVAEADPLVREVLELCAEATVRTEGWFTVDLPGGLDPSGLVKGWGVERAVGVLAERLPEHDACLNVGGDVAVRSPSGEAFTVGIEDPHDRARLLTGVPLAAGGLATSGTAARGLHIVDPHTGEPAQALASLSVVGPSLLWADVYATAAFARGLAGPAWIGGLPAYECLAVYPDGRTVRTAGWPAQA
jgi:thiamine biosynthesis lipoprotein